MTKNIVILVLISIIVLLLGRNLFWQPYNLDSMLIGTIEEIKVEEKFLADDEFIVIHEEDANPRSREAVYEIPVSNSDSYEVGQKVQVEIYSNTDTDVWKLHNMKFEIEILEE